MSDFRRRFAEREKKTSTPPKPPEGMVMTPGGYMLDTKAEAEHLAREGGVRQHVTGAAGQFVKGAPFIGEYFDEAYGAVDEALGGTPGLMRERARASQERFEQDHPYQSGTANVAGGITAAIPMALAAAPVASAAAPASIAGKVALGAGAGVLGGAAEGAVSGYGAGTDEESRSESALNRALVGGALGGVVGGLVPVASAAGRKFAKRLRNRPDRATAKQLGVSQEAADVVRGAIGNDDLNDAAANIAAGGETAMLADAGPATAGVLDTAIQKAGPGAKIARGAIKDRVETESANIQTALNDAFGAPIPAQAPKKLKAIYDAAYRAPIDYSGEAGRRIEDLLPRVPGSVLERANNLMRVEGVKSKQILAEVGDDGSVIFTELPDVRQLDYITRALNDVAKAGDGKGALGGNTNEGRIYAGLSRDIRKALKDAVPAYRAALNSAATEIGQKEARELGEVALRAATTRGDLREAMQDMPNIERARLAEGARSYIDDTIANVRRTMTDANVDAREGMKTLTESSSRSSQEKLEMVLGKRAAKDLKGKLDRAAKAFELRARTAENSKTFARQSMNETIRDITEPGAVGELAQGSPVAATRRVVQSLTGMSPAHRRETEERIAGEIATLLTGPRSDDAVKAARALIATLRREPETRMIADRVARIAGATTLSLGYSAGSAAAN